MNSRPDDRRILTLVNTTKTSSKNRKRQRNITTCKKSYFVARKRPRTTRLLEFQVHSSHQHLHLSLLVVVYDINHLMWPLGHIAFRPAINVARYYHTKLYLPAVADRDGIGS